MIEVAPEILALLVGVAVLAGFIDSIAGGGGLVTVPALLLAGAPPVTALATNKVQGVFGAVSAATHYARAGLVDPRAQVVPAALAFAASVGGALCVSLLPTDTLRLGLPVLLIAVALFFAFKPGLDDLDRATRLGPVAFNVTAVPIVAAYDGLLGPGAGSFYMLAFVLLAGRGVLAATAHTKLLNAASNAGGLCAFALIAEPWWIAGLAMGGGQWLGAQAGARVAAGRGAALIKPLLVAVTSAMALRLMWAGL
ncbi:TSUP family transporter [Jannaschia ovalis]|uniref:Probable membrane transporter protein n=1 Tax=Jannaschia ovalis TaxID=3038773 RepID=A0ABY8L890_9RHOB|nr:TSUP family transporter [Jannaschia sp. GRR-S6-38]WGH77511.1 TSUP family transporter [Jannaschia sp. GRR-S6-38]